MKLVMENRTGYGYSMDNPVKANGPMMSYSYIKSLRPEEGVVVAWYRDYSDLCKKTNRIVDRYSIYVLPSENATELKQYCIFVDMYNNHTDVSTPMDFD